MSLRRTHYELAFEALLDRRGTPYVAVEDLRHFCRRHTGVKTFDYLVYPCGRRACLIDVKGRKSTLRKTAGESRQKNWVTRADVDGLLAWQDVFGPGFEAMFAFVYWHAEAAASSSISGIGEDIASPLTLAGRRYSFWLVSTTEYARHQKNLSARWDTVSVPRAAFRNISRRLEAVWPSSPC